mmetsp:Transcript_624/g.1065  ORF Transcript_624/g.1065 Transcript_624/m.1065 type:complete len:84 (-) Transcript_624:5948-6199(-)
MNPLAMAKSSWKIRNAIYQHGHEPARPNVSYGYLDDKAPRYDMLFGEWFQDVSDNRALVGGPRRALGLMSSPVFYKTLDQWGE